MIACIFDHVQWRWVRGDRLAHGGESPGADGKLTERWCIGCAKAHPGAVGRRRASAGSAGQFFAGGKLQESAAEEARCEGCGAAEAGCGVVAEGRGRWCRRCALTAVQVLGKQVRKTPGWPRNSANSSLP